jgi:prepilin-type N-terminal cleavage/methylation domain-containing protein
MKTNNKGFTLIELLVVITIITILATISIPQFAKYRIRAYNAVAISDLRNAKVELEGFYLDPEKYRYPTADDGITVPCTVAGTTPGQCLELVSGFDFGFSNRDQHYYNADASGQYYTLATKNVNGDAVYASSARASRTYFIRNSTSAESDWAGVELQDTGALDNMPEFPATDGMFTSWGLM